MIVSSDFFLPFCKKEFYSLFCGSFSAPLTRSSGLWSIAIFFSWIFRLSFRSTCWPVGTVYDTELSWKIRLMVEKLSDRQHHRRWAEIVFLLQEELSILISLGGRTAEPRHRLSLVLWNPLSRQAQLAQHVLGVLVSRLRSLCEPICRSGGVLIDGVSLQNSLPRR